MSSHPLPLRRLWTPSVLPRRRSRFERMRVTLADGQRTTLHVASYESAEFTPQVVVLSPPSPLVRWCKEQSVRDAIVGGFFARPGYAPLGELRVGGALLGSTPFDSPWGSIRGCVQVVDGVARIARRDALEPDPPGDVLQAGPLLVSGGERAFVDGEDFEGFSAGARQFDSDITDGRYPRAALAIAGDRVLAVASDGRTNRDAGMTLGELAETLIALGASDALNLDGGGSASLVYDGRLRNRPREQHGVDLLEGRAVVSAVVFAPA